MNLVLPPKRFQDDKDPKYDSIRFKPWFRSLAERRLQLPMLQMAHYWIKAAAVTQLEAAEKYGVDARELRDYIYFISGLHQNHITRNQQEVVDRAYAHYCGLNAERHFRWFLEKQAPFFGIVPRHMTEAWEIGPDLYPTGYPFK